MGLTSSEKELITNYIPFHYHSPLNTNPEDYRHFNQIMFRAVKLNFIYTLAFSGTVYHLLHRSPFYLFKGYTSPGQTLSLIFFYSIFQYTSRLRQVIYSPESLACAQKYELQVEEYNDHFRRIYGNT